jgi:serine/threonine protein kinase
MGIDAEHRHLVTIRVGPPMPTPDDDPQFTNTLPSGGVRVATERAVASAPAADEAVVAQLGPGDFIGRFRIKDRIGEGGMGVVYAAEDPDLGRVVAIKLLRPMQGQDAESQQKRMLREAQALARVSHRNLVMVFDVGSLRGRVWIAMEYVAGQTLETWIDAERRTWSEIVGVFIEAGRGLAAVHAAGLVHRDFKPGNVIVRGDGTVQVLDFGLAARAGDGDEQRASEPERAPPNLDALAATLTTTGAFMGTPAYMAPEQFMMLPTDGRADQFSLCVALYEALYGHRPFGGRDLAELMAATIEGLPGLPGEVPGLPLGVRHVLARGLAKRPEDRFADMNALVAALEATRMPSTTTRDGAWRRFGLGMLAGGAVLAVGLGAWLATEDGDEADAASTTTPIVAPPTTPSEPAPSTATPPAKPSPRVEAPVGAGLPPPSSAAIAPGTTTANEVPTPSPGVARPGPAAAALPPASPTAPPSALPSLSDLDEPAPAPAPAPEDAGKPPEIDKPATPPAPDPPVPDGPAPDDDIAPLE